MTTQNPNLFMSSVGMQTYASNAGLNLADLIPVKMGAPVPEQAFGRGGVSKRVGDSGAFGNLDQVCASGDDIPTLKAMLYKIGSSVASVERSVKTVEERFSSFNSEQRDMNKAMSEQQVSFAKIIKEYCATGHRNGAILTPRVQESVPVDSQDRLWKPSSTGRVSSFSHNAFAVANMPGEGPEEDPDMLNSIFDEEDDAAKLTPNQHKTLGAGAMTRVLIPDLEIDKHPYTVTDFYSTEGVCQCIARTQIFENITLFVVMLNALYIGFESDRNNAANLLDATPFFICSSYFFCVYFTSELLVRFIAFENKLNSIKDGWFCFDLFLVLTMMLDICVITPILKYGAHGREIKIPTQPLRMLRLFKITRMARLMKVFPELVTLIRSMSKSIRAGSSTFLVVLVLNYVWGILMHMLMKEEDRLNNALYRQSFLDFSTVPRSMWCLAMNGTLLLDNAGPLMTQLIFADDPMLVLGGVAFVLYMFFSAQLIMQTLVAMLVDVVSNVNEDQKTELASGLLKQELLQDLLEFSGSDGTVSHSELMSLMSNRRSKAVLKKLNINTFLLYELQKMMYAQNQGRNVPVKKILELMLICRGDETVTVDTMARGFNFVCQDIHQVKTMLLHIGGWTEDELSRGKEENSKTQSDLRKISSNVSYDT